MPLSIICSLQLNVRLRVIASTTDAESGWNAPYKPSCCVTYILFYNHLPNGVQGYVPQIHTYISLNGRRDRGEEQQRKELLNKLVSGVRRYAGTILVTRNFGRQNQQANEYFHEKVCTVWAWVLTWHLQKDHQNRSWKNSWSYSVCIVGGTHASSDSFENQITTILTK